MEIELTETKTYSFKLGDKTLANFAIVSEWNGFTELRHPGGDRMIVHGMASASSPGFMDLWGDIFGSRTGIEKAPLRVRIVTASPDIIEIFEAVRAVPAP